MCKFLFATCSCQVVYVSLRHYTRWDNFPLCFELQTWRCVHTTWSARIVKRYDKSQMV